MQMFEKKFVEIHSRDYWVKVIEMLQQNWALIDPEYEKGQVRIYFFLDLVPPAPPFYRDEHPNGPIYSSGKFWRTGYPRYNSD